MVKYDLLPRQLIHEGIFEETDFFEPDFPDEEIILAVHDRAYFQKLKTLQLDKSEVRSIGFPLSQDLIDRELRIAQGTILGSEIALEKGVAFNIAGGTHHAFRHRGEAFCLLNDQAIAACYLLSKKLAKRILIIDLDVHQGNGTAQIFQANPQVFTFSMHGEKNYPFRKSRSNWDISLPDGTRDNDYLNCLKIALDKLLTLHNPDFIYYLSGVDVLETDKLGRLALSMDGCRQRDEMVFSLCEKYQIPVQCSMGGGYAPDIKQILEAHTNTYKVVRQIFF
jgi:acetoin utilization deacetylase AcuC-like enzyme